MNLNKDFDIVKLIELARHKKYETTIAGFGVIDKLERVPIPKKLKSRKISVQALHALSEGLVQYKYLTKDEKTYIAEELARRNPSYNSKNQNLFAPTTAPLSSEESEEDELPADDSTFKPDYVDDRYNEDTMQEEGDLTDEDDDDADEDDAPEEEED
ncbi:MAG: DNA primase [Leptospira sp.]|nr:DNA primase [Leptospira sp.]